MAYNNKIIERVAFGNFDVPNILSDAGASVQTGAYIPAGAIVTGLTLYSGGALTNAANMGNLTITPYVGAVAIGSNPICSLLIIETVANSLEAAAAMGVRVPVGGYVDLDFGNTANGTGLTANADIYVDYLYCSDKDTA